MLVLWFSLVLFGFLLSTREDSYFYLSSVLGYFLKGILCYKDVMNHIFFLTDGAGLN